MTSPVVESDRNNSLGILGALVAVSAWGIAGVVAKNIDMSGPAIGVYRFATFGLVASIFLAIRRTPVTRRIMRASMWGGIALGIDVALFFSAIKLTTVANATVIGALQPILISVVSARMFAERIRRREAILAGVAIGAVGAVVFGAKGAEGWSLRGDLLAVGALFAWSAYFVLSKRAKGVITSTEYTVGAALWTALINVPLTLGFGQSLGWPTWESWGWLIMLAFGSGLLGHACMNWSIQQIPLWLSSTFTLLVPVVSATTAWIFLGEPLTATQIVAIAVVLAALAGVVLGQP